VKFTPAILTMVLIALAALHAWWGVGGRWPGHDERSLVELVVGRTRSMRMPGLVVACWWHWRCSRRQASLPSRAT
jgi:hypothetical protein